MRIEEQAGWKPSIDIYYIYIVMEKETRSANSGRFLALQTGAITKWRNTKDWEDTEQFPHHITKANQNGFRLKGTAWRIAASHLLTKDVLKLFLAEEDISGA